MVNIERIYDGIRREERAALRQRTEEASRRAPQLRELARQRAGAFAEAAAGRLPAAEAAAQLRALNARERELLRGQRVRLQQRELRERRR